MSEDKDDKPKRKMRMNIKAFPSIIVLGNYYPDGSFAEPTRQLQEEGLMQLAVRDRCAAVMKNNLPPSAPISQDPTSVS